MPSLGFRVNTPAGNPSIPQAKVAGDGLISNWGGRSADPQHCSLSAPALSSTTGHQNEPPAATEEPPAWKVPLRIPRVTKR